MKKFTAIFVALMCFAATSFAGDLLTADMFHSWGGYEAGAEDKGATGCSYHMNEASASDGLPYGDGNVYYLNYADLTSYGKLVLEFTEGTPRLLFNREGDNGPLHPEINGSAGMEYVVAEAGKWTIDLEAITAAFGYAHLNCIKGANWANVTITTAELIAKATPEPNVKCNLLDDASFGFNDGTVGGWHYLGWNNGGTATNVAPGYGNSAGAMALTSTNPAGDPWGAQLLCSLKPGAKLEIGKTYTVSFWAKGDVEGDFIAPGAGGWPDPEWNNAEPAVLSTEWQLYTYKLVCDASNTAAGGNTQIYFNQGKLTGTAYVDQVIVTEDVNDQPLTTDLYKDYTTNPAGDAFATDLNINMNTRTVYGNKSIFAERYADLTPWNYMTVVFDTSKAPGTPQLIFNRQGVEDQSPEFLEINSASSEYVSYSQVDGTVNFWIIDLSKITEAEGFAHLNIIRGDKFVETYVTKLKLYQDDPAPGRFADVDYYLFNESAGAWLGGANAVGVQASLIKHPQPFKIIYSYGDYMIDSYTYAQFNKNNHFLGADLNLNSAATELGIATFDDGYSIAIDGSYLSDNDTTVLATLAGKTDAGKWIFYTKDQLEAKMLDENDPFIDATFYAQVPNFSNLQCYTEKGQSPWTIDNKSVNITLAGNADNRIAESSKNPFEISQTLTGLPTGIYRIDAQAAVLDNSNAYDGTNYPVIYGNYLESSFNSLDESLRGGATSYNVSDAFSAGEYQIAPMFVVVTDGTLKIGAKGDNANIKAFFDNFELTYIGDDIIAEGEYYLYNEEAGAWLGGANSWGTQASLIKHGMPVYIGEHQGGNVYTINTYTYNSAAQHYLGANLYIDADKTGLSFEKVGEAENEYIISANGTYIGTSADAAAYAGNDDEGTFVTPVALTSTTDASQATHWFLVTRAEREATLADATLDQSVDATFFIEVPNFSRNQAFKAQGQSPWTKEAANCNLRGGDNTNNNAESWRSSNGFKVYQTLNNLPNGVYKLYAQGAVCDYSKTNEDLAHLYANEKQRPFVVSSQATTQDGGENSMSEMSASFSAGKYQLKPIFVLVTDGTLEVGVESSRTDTWAVWDNFELYYLGADVDTVHVGPYWEMVASDKVQIEYEEGATVKEAGLQVAGYLNALHATSVDELVLFAVDTNAGLTFEPYSWVNFTGFYDAAGSVSGVANAAMKANLDLNAAKLTIENVEETDEPRYHAYAVVANPAKEKAVLVDIEVDFIDRPDFAATAIDNVNVNANKQIFDLTGREVKKATNGVYIINGVKTLVK